MSMERKICDFKDLPDDIPDNIGSNDSWTFGQGGPGHAIRGWFIEHINDDMTSEAYPLPEYLNNMIGLIRGWGQDEIRNSFKSLLKL